MVLRERVRCIGYAGNDVSEHTQQVVLEARDVEAALPSQLMGLHRVGELNHQGIRGGGVAGEA